MEIPVGTVLIGSGEYDNLVRRDHDYSLLLREKSGWIVYESLYKRVFGSENCKKYVEKLYEPKIKDLEDRIEKLQNRGILGRIFNTKA